MSFFQELKRRNVFRVGLAYVLLGWALLQGADFTLDLIGAPDWVIRTLAVVVAIGLPIALFFAWAFELTPEGIKRESEVDRTASVTPHTGRKLDRAIIAFLVLVIAVMGLERFYSADRPGAVDRAVDRAAANIATGPMDSEASTFKSIAVLPFRDLSAEGDQGWFADGLAEEILNALNRTPDLRVSSRTASFRYRESDLAVSDIAAELGVDHILEGSVRATDDQLRVTAQLIRAEDGFQLFSEAWDRPREDLIAIQEELAVSIARALETGMDATAMEAMFSAGTRSVDAYISYLKGLELLGGAIPRPFDERRAEALELFERAVDADPGFARAWVQLAHWWRLDLSPQFIYAGYSGLSPEAAQARFDGAIGRAIETAGSEQERRGYRALLAEQDVRIRETIAIGEAYLEERPNDWDFRVLTLHNAIIAGDQAATRRQLEALKTMGRKDLTAAISVVSLGHRVAPGEVADYGLERLVDYPDHPGLLYQTHRALLWDGRTEEAGSLVRRLPPDYVNRYMTDLRQACAEGRTDAATAIYERKVNAGTDPLSSWQMLTTLGRKAEATEAVSELLASGTPFQITRLLGYPSFDPTPFPQAMEILDREGILVGPAIDMPFACEPASGPSIAVLPFLNMSADPDNEFFSDGVSEEILNVLAGIPELKVASRTSAFRFKDSELGIDEIAAALGVNHVLEGSVRKAGDQVRITAQLIHAEDGFHLWSETYDRELDDIFAIQDEIAGDIAGVLEVELLGAPKNHTTVADLSPAAYESFLEARFLMRRRNAASLDRAIELNEQVLAEAPDFPRGLVQQAEALAIDSSWNDVTDHNTAIDGLVERALALDPDLAAAWMMKGAPSNENIGLLTRIRHLERALELDASEPRIHHWLGINFSLAGYPDRAQARLEQAVALEPDHANATGYLGRLHFVRGNMDEARRLFERQNQLGNDIGAFRVVLIDIVQGDLDAARASMQRLGVNEYAAEYLNALMDALEGTTSNEDWLARYLGDADGWTIGAMVLGEYDAALQDIDKENFWMSEVWATAWPGLRARPEFQELSRRAGMTEVWDALGPPPACRKVANGYDCANGESP